MSLTTEAPDKTAPASPHPSVGQILAGFLLPLFFLVGLPLGLVSAFHAPSPHDLSLKIVGPTQVVSQIATGLDKTKEFSATHTDVVSEARSSVRNRDVDGAIRVDVHAAAVANSDPAATAPAASKPTFTVTTYVANAAGRSQAAAVEAVGAKIASQLGASSTVVDVAPLAATDSLGTTLFYILTYSSLGGYLTIIVLTQVNPRARLRTKFAAVAGVSIVAPLLTFGLASIWVGDYGASFGTIVGLLGVDALSVFTVGTLAILIQSLLGNAAIFGLMAAVVMLNFPSAGGAVPASMLPPFWQFMHQIWFGAGAYESFRSIVYFGGAGVAHWLLQLLAWTAGAILVTFTVDLVKKNRRNTAELAKLRPLALQHRRLQASAATAATQQVQNVLTTRVESAR